MRIFIFMTLFCLTLIGCSAEEPVETNIPTTTAAKITPTSPLRVTHTSTLQVSPTTAFSSTPQPSSTATSTSQPGLTPTQTATMALQDVQLSAPLYFWIRGRQYANFDRASVWRLDPGKLELARVTPLGMNIIAFDVWPGDGRLAYATENGDLYLVMPEEEPLLVYQAGQWLEMPLIINTVAWSPDGTRLAYGVDYGKEPVLFVDVNLIAQPTGIWIMTIQDRSSVQFVRNSYVDYVNNNVNTMRIFFDIAWAPDGTALLIKAGFWEGGGVFLYDPLVPNLDETNLHALAGTWHDVEWSYGSQAFLLSDGSYGDKGKLVLVERASLEAEQLIGGPDDGGLIPSNAQEFPEGIVFAMSVKENDIWTPYLYLGQQTADGFSYTMIGPGREIYTHRIVWDPSGKLAVLSSSLDAQIISLDGNVDFDLTPYLALILEQYNKSWYIEAFWGPDACAGILSARLWVDGFAYVDTESSLSSNLREAPGKEYLVVGAMPAGGVMEVLEGPVCADGLRWWKVQDVNPNLISPIGWIVEGDADSYWLAPCSQKNECGPGIEDSGD